MPQPYASLSTPHHPFCWFTIVSRFIFVRFSSRLIEKGVVFCTLPFRTKSPIFSVNVEVSGVVDEEAESVHTNGFSLTEPGSFSDGVWLDPDGSEGEYGGIAIRGFEEFASLNKKLGPLPSPSEVSTYLLKSNGSWVNLVFCIHGNAFTVCTSIIVLKRGSDIQFMLC